MSEWSHAGGVVVRTIDGKPQYLLVAASDNPDIWLLPKGRIERGETAEAAAVREVDEEAGVRATVVAPAGESEYERRGKTVRTIYFLMEYQADTSRTEDRAHAWHRYEDALALLHFNDLRSVLTQAHARARGGSP